MSATPSPQDKFCAALREIDMRNALESHGVYAAAEELGARDITYVSRMDSGPAFVRREGVGLTFFATFPGFNDQGEQEGPPQEMFIIVAFWGNERASLQFYGPEDDRDELASLEISNLSYEGVARELRALRKA